MTQTLFTNISIFDGSGKKSYRGEVLVQGNRIKKVVKGKKRIERNGAEVVDGGGATLMPGLINGHSHIGYSEEGTSLYSLGDTPPEENTLITMRHAQILYDHGFTALVCAATGKTRMDIVTRNEINAGRMEGPSRPRGLARADGHRRPRRRAPAPHVSRGVLDHLRR